MKNWTFGIFAALAFLAGSATLTGCLDPCKKVACVNGQCAEGECNCNAGYEGADCSIPVNAKVSGSYHLIETCFPSGEFEDDVLLTPLAGTVDKFTYNGVWGEHVTDVVCQIGDDGLSFTFERVTLNFGTGRDAECNYGVISEDGKTIDLIYKIYIGNSTTWDDSCTTRITR